MPNELLDVSSNATKTQLLAAITALSGVIGFLYRIISKKHADTEGLLLTRWEECESKHAATQDKLLSMSSEVGQLKGKIEVLSSDVLKQIHGEGSDGPPSSGIT